MVRKLFAQLIVFCLIVTTPYVAGAASVSKPIKLFMNNKQIADVNPIVNSGVMYVPYRKFFDAMGYEVAYDPNTRQISGVINGAEIKFWVGENIVEYNDINYFLENVIPVFNGQVYIPLRQFGYFAKYSVYFDQPNLTVSLQSYGFGQESAVKELVTKYHETSSPKLLTSDNLTLGYKNLEYDYEANLTSSEIPVRDFKVTIDHIEYTSKNEAKLQVTYIEHTEELNREDVFAYKIRFEQGQWKIAHESWIYNKMELPEDIDKKAAAIKENHFSEQNAVLSNLRTYYTAFNAEELDRTLKYTAPSFIKEWNDRILGPVSWEDNLKANFLYSDERIKLSDERVVFLGKKEAVVQAMFSWSDATEDYAEGDYVYETLIYMEYANGRWTYNYNISLDQDFDRSEGIVESK